MGIRMSGLASGLDTESIVAALMSSKRAKQTKAENKKTKLEWKQEKWADLNKKMYSFYTDYAGKMRFQGSYKTKKATSSDTSKVTASCSSTAASGSYSLKISSLASAQYVTGAKLGKDINDKAITTSTKLSDLGYSSTGFSQINITSGTKSATLNVDSTTTVSDFLSSCEKVGLNATFDKSQGRLFISSASSGSEHAFTITSSSFNSDQTDAMTYVQSAMNYTGLTDAQKNSVNSILGTLQNSTSATKDSDAITKLMTISDNNTKSIATTYYTDQLTAGYTAQYKAEDGTLTEDGRQAIIDSGVSEEDYALMTDEDKTKAIDKIIKNKVKANLAEDEYKDKISQAVSSGLTTEDGTVITKGSAQRNMEVSDSVLSYIEAMDEGVTPDAGTDDTLSKLGLANITGNAITEGSGGTGMVVKAASDSVVQLNGATLTSSTTTLEANGLTLDLLGTTGEDEIKLSVSNDTAGIYDSIKEFITQYNTILSTMNSSYNAASAGSYDVLSDDDKKSMTDDQIEKWDNKIKDSLLRRDTTLSSLISTFREATSATYTASNGKTYSLANLGITTSTDYTEKGLLHIKGDEDDSEYSDSKNTLESLLNSDPDTVAEVMAGITSKLYDELGKKMASSTMSSALTFYNDKEIKNQLNDYKTEVSDWESKLADLEDRYYSQFTAMEKALASLNSQQSTLSGYFS